MSLADYQPETRVIPVGATSFSVRGLSLTDITSLIRYHLPDVEALFDLGASTLDGKTELTNEDLTKISVALAEQAPGFVANLIALSAGESTEEAINNAYKLPFPVQIKALHDIADLTFAEVGGIKKGLESVAGLLKKVTPMIPQPKPESRR